MTEQNEQQDEVQSTEPMDERTMLARVMSEYDGLSEQELIDAKAFCRHQAANFRIMIEACDRLIERHQNRRALAEATAASQSAH